MFRPYSIKIDQQTYGHLLPSLQFARDTILTSLLKFWIVLYFPFDLFLDSSEAFAESLDHSHHHVLD